MDSILSALLNFGIGGLMAAGVLWLLWYRETITLPRLLERFTAELREERSACERRHAEGMGGHALVLGEVRETRDAVKSLHDEVRLHRALVDDHLGRRKSL